MSSGLTIQLDDSGNIIVTCTGEHGDGAGMHGLMAKFDARGVKLWERPLLLGVLQPDAPAPVAAVDDDARDSVQPLVMEASQTGRQSVLPQVRRAGRTAVALAGLMALGAVGFAGGAAVRRAAARAQRPPPVARTGLRQRLSASGLERAIVRRRADVVRRGRTAEQAVMLPPQPARSAAELRAETLELLTAGSPELALVSARAYRAAAPEHALSYLMIGAALQDLGRAAEARTTYSACVRYATRGDATECWALGGRR